MSWEVMQTRTGPCDCGAGTETYTLEVDDWNRTRNSTEICCPNCLSKREQQIDADQEREERRIRLLGRAQQLLLDRYCSQWLELFAGKTKKAAWLRYTGGVGYPTLATFYQHVQHSGGLIEHLRWCLVNDLKRSMLILGIEDAEIKELLKERDALWKPVNKSM